MLHSKIIPLLNSQGLIGSQGKISLSLLNMEVEVSTKDVIGSLLQDWFGNWMTGNGIEWTTGPHAQSWPDFILSNGEHLEFKAFDGSAGPNFDLANFDAFTRSLLTNPERLDTEHLIFEYELNPGGVVIVTNFWAKKIWEMTGPSQKNILNLQVKQGVPINIRPKNWRTASPNVSFFGSRLEFVRALEMALTRFYPDRYQGWFNSVQAEYRRVTGGSL